jgi:hypothetical protein
MYSFEKICVNIVMCMEWLEADFGLLIGFTGLFDTAREYTLQFTITHTHTHTSVLNRVFISRRLVATYNGRRSPFSVFPNCPRSQLRASHSNSSQRLNLNSPLTHSLTNQLLFTSLNSNKLTPVSAYNISARTTQERPFLLQYNCCHGNILVCSAVT